MHSRGECSTKWQSRIDVFKVMLKSLYSSCNSIIKKWMPGYLRIQQTSQAIWYLSNNTFAMRVEQLLCCTQSQTTMSEYSLADNNRSWLVHSWFLSYFVVLNCKRTAHWRSFWTQQKVSRENSAESCSKHSQASVNITRNVRPKVKLMWQRKIHLNIISLHSSITEVICMNWMVPNQHRSSMEKLLKIHFCRYIVFGKFVVIRRLLKLIWAIVFSSN